VTRGVLTAQHLVVGSGAGGALTAARLAEAGHEVILVEEGLSIEAESVEPFSLEQMGLQYRHKGVSAALGRPIVAYAEGRCLGGSTEINSGLYHLANAELLAEWRNGWGVAELDHGTLRHHAREPEETLGIQHLPERHAFEASNVLRRGATSLGWSAMEVPRAYRYEGVAARPVKQSMSKTYLPRAMAAGARVLTGTRVDRVLVRHGRVTGARASTTSGSLKVSADHVWVCGGAIATPALLQRSGVGRGAGRTLSLHPTVKVVARFDAPLDAARDVPVHQIKEFAPDLSFGGSVSRRGYLALALSDNWADNRALLDEHCEELAIYYAAIRPRQASGRVRALPGLRDPLVTFQVGRADLRLLASGLRRLAHLLFAAGARSLHPSLSGAQALLTADDVATLPTALPRSAKLMTVHLCSSVPMGERRDRCPADSYGRIRGVAGLRVNDASLLPSAPGINPQGTIMAIAARNCAQFLAEGR
jgi:choline dehydrogenase-like flavoprotein